MAHFGWSIRNKNCNKNWVITDSMSRHVSLGVYDLRNGIIHPYRGNEPPSKPYQVGTSGMERERQTSGTMLTWTWPR